MLLRLTIAFVFLLASVQSYSQLREVDSLESLVKTVPADTTKVWLLNRLVTSLRETDNNKALAYAEQSLNLAQVLNYKNGQSLAMENLGWIYYRRGDYSKSFELSTQSLKLAEAMDDKVTMAKALNNIAAIKIEQKQVASAIEHFKKAYAISKQINDYNSMGRSLNNVAYAYFGIKSYDSAFAYINKALKINKLSNNLYMTGFSYRTLGDLFYEKVSYREALLYYDQAFVLAIQAHNVFLEVSTQHRIAKCYMKLGDNNRAIAYLRNCINTASKTGYKDELERSYKILSELYASIGDIKNAFDFQTKYLTLHDSIYTQRSSEQLALVQARFDSEMKQAQIELLTKDAQLKQEEINQQRIWMYFYIGCVTLLIMLAFVLIFNYNLKKRATVDLTTKNKEIQLQAQQLGNLNVTKDKLFSIISHDLRSPLASLRGLIDLVIGGDLSQSEFSEISKKVKKNLDTVNEDLDNLLLWSQSQLKGLQVNPQTVSVKVILDEKIQLYKELAKSKSIEIVNELEDEVTVVADKNHLGLVLRNLLGNAIKFNKQHGSIVVSQKDNGQFVEISVTDSGVGMDDHDLKRLFNAETHFTNLGTNHEKGAGIGLLLVKEFVEKNGGAIWVTSELGKGSTFTFRLKRHYVSVETSVPA